MPPVGFEPTISSNGWLEAQALYRAATGIGFFFKLTFSLNLKLFWDMRKVLFSSVLLRDVMSH